uniref:Myotubularin phosphatase domain-containing protein n=1 Tax=Echinostoma caproni TaxID=27848 RepID=A0A183A0Q9_9TREM
LYDNTDSVDELWSIFARTSLVICQPDSAQLRCPPRMHIRPLVTSVLTEPGQLPRNENVSPHCFRNDLSRWTKDPRQMEKLLHQCRYADEHEVSECTRKTD